MQNNQIMTNTSVISHPTSAFTNTNIYSTLSIPLFIVMAIIDILAEGSVQNKMQSTIHNILATSHHLMTKGMSCYTTDMSISLGKPYAIWLWEEGSLPNPFALVDKKMPF